MTTIDPSIETIQLDMRGMKCPAPILNTAKEARKLNGQHTLIRILSDDDAFPMDLKSWCRSSKARVLSLDRVTNGAYQAVVEVNPKSPPSRTLNPLHQSQPPQSTPPKSSPTHQYHTAQHDYRGMKCPAPILALAKTVRQLNGSPFTLTLTADDAAFPMDLKSWCRSANVSIVDITQDGSIYTATIQRTSSIDSPAAQTSQTTPTPHTTPTPVQTAQPTPAAPPAQTPSAQPTPAQGTHIKLILDDANTQASLKRLDALNNLGLQDAHVSVTSPHVSLSTELLSWCSRHKHTLTNFESSSQGLQATISLNPNVAPTPDPVATTALVPAVEPAQDNCTLLVLHNDFEALMAALMCANASAVSGMKTKIYFSFWGVNLLRADSPRNIPAEQKPTFLQRVFKWMMPKGPGRQQLGKLNFAGMGTSIMKGLMAKNQIMNLNQLMASAVDQGVEFVICTTSMTIMGLDKRDLAEIETLQYGGVASFMEDSRFSKVSLVF